MVVLSIRQDRLKQFSIKYLFRKDKTGFYQVNVLMVNRIARSMFFLAWKDLKFQKSYNFPGNTNFERLLFDQLNMKSNCSY